MTDHAPPATTEPPAAWLASKWAKAALALAALALIVLVWRTLPVAEWIEQFRDWVGEQGVVGHLVFILVYVLATVVLAPAGLLTLAAGFAFGFWAFPTVVIGATIGLTLAFLIARYGVRGWVEKRASSSRLFRAVDKAIESEGWKIVALMRLSPLVPFNLQNYFFGITGINFWSYLAASFFGIMPGTLLYVWIGSLGAAAGSSEEASTAKLVGLGIGLVATLAVTIIVSRKAQEKLREIGVAEDTASPPPASPAAS